MAIVAKVEPASSMQAAARWIEGERFSTEGSSGHGVELDSDRERNRAPGPMEMVLRSLCACSATDIAIIFAKARQGLQRLEVLANAERATQPPRVFTRIHLRYVIAAEHLDPAVAARAVALSQEKYCSVLAMLSRTAVITHSIELEPASHATAAADRRVEA